MKELEMGINKKIKQREQETDEKIDKKQARSEADTKDIAI